MKPDIRYTRELRTHLVAAIARQRRVLPERKVQPSLRIAAIAGLIAVVGFSVWVGANTLLDETPPSGRGEGEPVQGETPSALDPSPTRTTTRSDSDSGKGSISECEFPIPSLEEFLDDESRHSYYDSAFTGEVVEIGDPVKAGVPGGGLYVPDKYFPVLVQVDEVLLGTVQSHATVMVPVRATEMVEFKTGAHYEIVAHENDDATYATSSCVPTNEVAGGDGE